MSLPSEDREDAVASLLAEALEPLPVDTAVRARLLDALRGAERFAPFAAEVARAFGLSLDDTRAALRMMADASAWRQGPWPGSRLLATPALMQRRAVIAELPAGVRIPLHAHRARELTYILDGELLEDQRVRLGRGQLLEMLPGTQHEIAVPLGEPCLVVFTSGAD